MLEGKSLGLVVFTMLNAMGVAFLLYVLVHFWNEGHKSKEATRPESELSVYGIEAKVFVVSSPMATETGRQNGRLIPFPIPEGSGQHYGNRNDVPGGVSEASRSVAR
jgi:hypothetical protein